MSNNTENNGGLYFIVGALVIAVGVMGYMYFGGDHDGRSGASVAIEKTSDAVSNPVDLKVDVDRR
ncbi:MAG TPA: hypothetical protein VEF76_03200 [Patescibacteria group bacterium]|nr:hypothetical protein [Patescibacteria group bacterium]